MGLCGVHEGKRSESRLFSCFTLCLFFYFMLMSSVSIGKTGELGNSQVACVRRFDLTMFLLVCYSKSAFVMSKLIDCPVYPRQEKGKFTCWQRWV